MDRMEMELFDAAAKGCIISLQNLLKDDPLILDRVGVSCFNETPLHVAALLGHIDFVKEVVRIKPELVNELNSQGSSPLHLASAKGHVEVVKALLSASADSRAFLAPDRNELTPLHLAAAKGRVEVMKLFLRAQPDAARVVMKSILHLCVENYQLEALKLVLESVDDTELINIRDCDGSTVLHLAVAYKQVETIRFLLTVAGIQVNTPNHDGLTPVDVLIRSRRDVRDSWIEQSLKYVGGFESSSNTTTLHHNRSSYSFRQNGMSQDWLERKKSALMIVASLIATMAFQVGVNPPGGVWQDDNTTAVGSSVMAYTHREEYPWFCLVNTIGFVASLSIILLLMSGLPLTRRLHMWILMVMTWTAIAAITATYSYSVLVLTPYRLEISVFNATGFFVYLWLILMAILLISHTIHLLVKVIRKLMDRRE